jgi:hypothetical protein
MSLQAALEVVRLKIEKNMNILHLRELLIMIGILRNATIETFIDSLIKTIHHRFSAEET